MNWTPADVDRAIVALTQAASLTDAIVAIREWRPGTSKDALRKALDFHGKKSPTVYLGAGRDDEAPITARSGHVDVPTVPPKESARAQPVADRSHVAPMAPRFGAPGQRWLFIPDTHVPYHDHAAWRLALAVARALRPDGVCILGDFLDCYAVSFHEKSPARVSRLADEIAATDECLAELEAATPNARRVFVEGNHENRVNRYIASQAKALHGMRLDERGWAWVPYHEHCTIGDTAVTHDGGRAGVYAVRQTMMAMGQSLIIGHVHRVASQHESTLDGRAMVGHSFGWLGSHAEVDYRHRALARREWPHAVGVGTIDASGVLHSHAVPFVGGRAVVFGQEVRA
jgi:UDP-2,3-diacylglucosamine pyrophosphatase LpxH